eukprot:scaffold193803_cov32-Tisochrysis_lutea.AAC.3
MCTTKKEEFGMDCRPKKHLDCSSAPGRFLACLRAFLPRGLCKYGLHLEAHWSHGRCGLPIQQNLGSAPIPPYSLPQQQGAVVAGAP